MDKKIKLAFCTDGIFPYSVGGMQRHSRLLVEALATYNIDIIVFHPHQERLFEKFDNIREIYIQDIDKNKNYLQENYKYSKRIYEHLKNMPEHVVYSQGMSVWHKIKNLKNKIIINPHGLESYQAIGIKDRIIAVPFKIIFNRIFNRADFVVSLGGILTDILKKNITNYNTEIAVLPNGVNLPENKNIYSPKNSDLNLFFISRFAANKGIDILLEVAESLNSDGYTDIKYKLAGKGPLFETLKSKYKADNIDFLGFVSDEELSELYDESDAFVLPTLFEGMPTVVLEAMSHSLPIIVTNVGATAELVDLNNGFLIQKNSKSELKKAILNFIELTTEKKIKLSENSYNKIKDQFTWSTIAKKHIELFKNVEV
jgi:glycosyltransferase involved in cell wall biosynthesis